jgi:O-antigen ligase
VAAATTVAAPDASPGDRTSSSKPHEASAPRVNTQVSIRRRPASWAWRIALLLAAVLYVAGPLAAVLAAPTVPWWVTATLAALALASTVTPRAAPALLLVVVPLLPILPSLVPGVPAAVVHLVLLAVAIPVLVRMALSRSDPGPAVFVTGWSLFLLVAAVSAGVDLTPDRLRGAALSDVWRDLASEVPSYVFAQHPLRNVSALPLLLSLADGLLCGLVVHATVTRSTRRRVLVAAAAGAVATVIAGFAQAYTGIGLQSAWQIFDPGIVRINATFVDPNALAAYYALIGPVILALALGAGGWRRGLWAAAFLAVCTAMVMTAGRTGLFSLALACLLLFWLGFRRRLDEVDPWPIMRQQGRTIARRTCLAAVAALCVVVLAGTALNVSHAQQTSYLHTWLYTFNLRQPVDSVAKGRMAVWQTMGAMVRDAPLVGVGLGMGVYEFERYRRALGVDSLPPDARLSAHNTFLLVAGDLGLLGLSAWLLMMLTVVHGIRAPGNLPARDPATWPTLGLVAGLAGLTVTMLTGDRILLREDIVIGTTCAALASPDLRGGPDLAGA